MKDHTTNPLIRKTLHDLPLRVINSIGSKIFRADDRRAHNHGWQIVARHGGLSRTYRDPRFDYLVTCGACNGPGLDHHGAACSSCNGTGRTVTAQTDVSRSAGGQS